MAFTTFSIGDVVRLRSGGPLMTVIGIGSENDGQDKQRYSCGWFNYGTGVSAYVYDVFPAAALEDNKRDDLKPGTSD